MKNYLTTSFKSARSVLYLLVLLCIGSTSLLGQRIEIATTDGGTDDVSGMTIAFCDLACDSVRLHPVVYDADTGGNVVPIVGLMWTLPNGTTTNDIDLVFSADANTLAGDYTVQVILDPTITSIVTVEIDETFEIECPEQITVSVGEGCDPMLMETIPVVSFDNSSCTGTVFSYSTQLDITDGVQNADVGTGPLSSTDIALDPINFFSVTGGETEIFYGTHNLLLLVEAPVNGATVAKFSCEIEIEVVDGSVNVACNDDLNVTLSKDCEIEISPEMILEGAFCFESFTVDVDGFDAGSTITLDAPGSYVVSVTNTSTGVSCWGTINAEDKTIPEIECTQSATVRCSVADNINPGTRITDFVVVSSSS